MIKKVSLLVKGSEQLAIEQARKHGLKDISVATRNCSGITVLWATTNDMKTLVHWITQDRANVPPYPVGALMSYHAM